MTGTYTTIDGNEACAAVAYQTSEVLAIYPITPASPMGELADAWSAAGHKNIFGTVPEVIEMQSEGGAAGAVHGALQSGALTSTFTASQGLLLMVPNMFKIAGELTSTVFHIAARAVATHALSIFGDHSDVMAARSTGWAMLFSSSVQEAHDLALIAHAATLRSRIPFLHIFDGFRTSHEVNKIQSLEPEQIRAMIDESLVHEHRRRGLDPEHPVLRGSAQNPDVFFQAREAVNPFYLAAPGLVQEAMDEFAVIAGRAYHLFDYHGHPDAERVLVLAGSGLGAAEEAVDALIAAGEKVGLVKVRLFRPFSGEALIRALPTTTRRIAVLDRTKEPGAIGEPLYQDVLTALAEQWPAGDALPRVCGGRFGLSSKEFTPAMAVAVFRELGAPEPRRHFTVGIVDDVTGMSLTWDRSFSTEREDEVRALFYGLGSDGTVGANKNSVKIVGEHTDLHAQGYFVYDSRKAGAVTISHLRFGPRPIRSTYLIDRANFVACHQFHFLSRMDVLEKAEPGATFLLNSPYGPDTVWDHLPVEVQEQIIEKGLRLFVIDADHLAKDAGLGGRINTVMQPCFFALAGVLPREEAIARIKESIEATYGKRGRDRGGPEPRSGGPGGRIAPRGDDSQAGDFGRAPGAARAGRRPRLRAAGHRPDDRGARRPAAGQRHARGRDVPNRHREVREAEHREGDSDLGSRDLHRVRPVRAGVSARRHPHEGLRSAAEWRDAGRLQVQELEGQGLPRQGSSPSRSPPTTAPAAASASRSAPPAARRKPVTSRSTWNPRASIFSRSASTSSSSCRFPRSIAGRSSSNTINGSQLLQPLFEFSGALRRLRRDAVSQAADAALRRPDGRRQRDRLLFDLRRQSPDDALVVQRAGPRALRGPTRCSRTTPSSDSACAWRSTRRPQYARRLLPSFAGRPRSDAGRGAAVGRSERRSVHRAAAGAGGAAQGSAGEARVAARPSTCSR